MGTELTYFSLLGISEDAGQEELEARYQELAEYLASPNLPANMRDWAAKQATLVDEAYAVLADPERRAAIKRGPAAAAPEARAEPGRAAEPAPQRAKATADEAPPARASLPQALLRGLRSQPLAVGIVVGLAALGAVILFRVGLPGGGGAEEGTPAATQASDLVPLDEKRVAELQAAIAEDPNNLEALFELAEAYFLAGEWQPAIDWFNKVIALEPSNVHALTDIGTSNYNLGFTDEAKTTWLGALEIDAKDPQLHYNLGFLYANSEPPDMAAAVAEWQTVVELAPDSNLAKTVQVHLEGLADPTPEATPAAP